MPTVSLTEMPHFGVEPMTIETGEFQEVVSSNGTKPGMLTADGLTPISVVFKDGKIRSYGPNQYGVMKIGDVHIPNFYVEVEVEQKSMTGGKRESKKSKKSKKTRKSKNRVYR
jgi:hypothetical protein